MIKDLVRLDPSTVQLWNGEKWTQVLGWGRNPRPEEPIEIELRSGERIGCTPDHLWPTQRGNVRADEIRLGDVIQTCRLPEPAAPLMPKNIPDEVGWLVGLYLAEGSRSGDHIQISGHIKEVERFERLCALAADFGGSCRMHQTSENGVTMNIHGKLLCAIIDTYIGGTNAKTKHLSNACWQRSNAFLQNVLDGYLSGDGHWDKGNNRWRLGFTENYALAQDLRTLCARLGAKISLRQTTQRIGGKGYPSFKGEIRFEWAEHHNSKPMGEVVSIGRNRGREFWDISVEDEPHLFALASGVLTHNCKTNPMPESVRDRCTRSHEYIFMLTKSKKYFYDAEAIAEPLAESSVIRVSQPNFDNQTGGDKDYGPNSNRSMRGTLENLAVKYRTSGNKARHIPDGCSTSHKNNHLGRSIPWVPKARTGKTAFRGQGAHRDWGENGPANRGQRDMREVDTGAPTRNCRDVWQISTKPCKEAHFATFPADLPERCILSSTSEIGACPHCCAPWQRVTETTKVNRNELPPDDPRYRPNRSTDVKYSEIEGRENFESGKYSATETRGWEPTCKCEHTIDDVVPCVVLDPFSGAGTTAMVALELGRSALGLELNPEYAAMSKKRIRRHFEKLEEKRVKAARRKRQPNAMTSPVLSPQGVGCDTIPMIPSLPPPRAETLSLPF